MAATHCFLTVLRLHLPQAIHGFRSMCRLRYLLLGTIRRPCFRTPVRLYRQTILYATTSMLRPRVQAYGSYRGRVFSKWIQLFLIPRSQHHDAVGFCYAPCKGEGAESVALFVVVDECLDAPVSRSTLVYRCRCRTCLGCCSRCSCVSPLLQARTACKIHFFQIHRNRI